MRVTQVERALADVPRDVNDLERASGGLRPRFTPPWRRLSAAAALLMLAACSHAPAATGAPVNVVLHDFRIDSATAVSSNADVVFHVHNLAPATHEFVVVRTDLAPDRLPIGSDGLSVDEEKLQKVGEIGEVGTETTQTLALHLSPGRYVFFCNLDGHYLGGMHGVLEVTGGA
jgi:hypothetical protein